MKQNLTYYASGAIVTALPDDDQGGEVNQLFIADCLERPLDGAPSAEEEGSQ